MMMFFSKKSVSSIITGICLLSVASIIFACCVGSVSLTFSQLVDGFQSMVLQQMGHQGQVATLASSLVELRLFRAISGFVTGATLALSGVLMQALLRNPLADPYVLGLSGGASVGALTTILFFGAGIFVDVAAFAGALSVAALLFLLAYRDLRGSGSSEGSAPLLLLTGVIVASGCGAIVSLILTMAPDSSLRGMVFWMIGDLSNTQPRYWSWLILAVMLALMMKNARAINIVAMHAHHASTLGVNVGRLRQILFVSAALLTASAVSNAGSIGFVGLIIPHACRFVLGSDHRLLIPVASLAGGSFLVFADTLARTVVSPHQLPVGVITAIIGVPIFLIQLHQLRRH